MCDGRARRISVRGVPFLFLGRPSCISNLECVGVVTVGRDLLLRSHACLRILECLLRIRRSEVGHDQLLARPCLEHWDWEIDATTRVWKPNNDLADQPHLSVQIFTILLRGLLVLAVTVSEANCIRGLRQTSYQP